MAREEVVAEVLKERIGSPLRMGGDLLEDRRRPLNDLPPHDLRSHLRSDLLGFKRSDPSGFLQLLLL